jgi:geranylgeranyl pyrophosphate synthase
VRTQSREGIFRFLLTFECWLERCFPVGDDSLLNRALRHALFPGGKRIRPMLCITAYEACLAAKRQAASGKRLVTILPVAAAIELIHTFSLIQDDLPAMDDDTERRGRPALHVAFGEATALLASDALFARAFELLAGADASPARCMRVVAEIARAIGKDGLVAGQLQDISAEMSNVKCQMSNTPIPDIPLRKVLRHIHCLKTARLIAVSFKSGAIIAAARPSVVSTLEQAGTYLGMLFQITDDLLDVATERRGAGKSGDSALRTPRSAPEVLTYPSLYGVEGSRSRARGYQARYQSALRRIRSDLSPGGYRDLQAAGEMILARTQ